MSYNGTVHCSYCGKKGHNRLGCPERRSYALKNPDTYEGKRWHREQERRKSQIENRLCSYCKQPKHNRRGCPTLKEDKILVRNRQEQYLKEFLNSASNAKFGPGSLVKVPQGHFHKDDPSRIWSKGFVAMVTSFKWDRISFLLDDQDLNRGWRASDTPVVECRVVAPFGYTEKDHEDYWRRPPKFNDKKELSATQVHGIMSDIIGSSTKLSEDQTSRSVQLVGPAEVSLQLPDDLELLTENLNSMFHFQGRSRDEWDNRRVELHSDIWSKVRKEEHLQAKGGKV